MECSTFKMIGHKTESFRIMIYQNILNSCRCPNIASVICHLMLRGFTCESSEYPHLMHAIYLLLFTYCRWPCKYVSIFQPWVVFLVGIKLICLFLQINNIPGKFFQIQCIGLRYFKNCLLFILKIDHLAVIPTSAISILQTCFYFDVERDAFRKSLDKFAQFFVAPLLLRDSVDREIEAVDSGEQLVWLRFILPIYWYKLLKISLTS